MHPELEALLVAYDAAREGGPEQLSRFKLLLSDFLQVHPNVRDDVFLQGLQRRHRQWVRSQQQPPTIPPKA